MKHEKSHLGVETEKEIPKISHEPYTPKSTAPPTRNPIAGHTSAPPPSHADCPSYRLALATPFSLSFLLWRRRSCCRADHLPRSKLLFHNLLRRVNPKNSRFASISHSYSSSSLFWSSRSHSSVSNLLSTPAYVRIQLRYSSGESCDDEVKNSNWEWLPSAPLLVFSRWFSSRPSLCPLSKTPCSSCVCCSTGWRFLL